MAKLFHDFETFCDLDVRDVGADVYARHPSAEVLMLSYALDAAPVKLWIPAEGEPPPEDLVAYVRDPSVTLHAFNAPFERAIWNHVLKVPLPIERFRDTAVEAYSLSFAGSLGDVGEQIGLPQDQQKMAVGKRLINRFCKPAPSNHKASRYTLATHPDEWALFKQYCMQDVEAERAIHWWCEPYNPVSEFEWSVVFLSEAINERGLPIDLDLVHAAAEMHQIAKARLLEQMRVWTGLPNPNSAAQLQPWLAAQGVPLGNLQAATIEAVFKDPLGVVPAHVKQVLDAKRRVAMNAPAKWLAYLARTAPDGRMRGGFQYAGASRTGRWSSRGQNLQNLKSPRDERDMDAAAGALRLRSPELIEALYGDPIEFLASMVRTGIAAPDDQALAVADLASIESRVVGWLTDCKFFNETFAAGRCTYKTMAIDLFGVGYEDVTKKQRKFAKPVVLAGPYGQWGPGLREYAKGYGVELTEEDAIRHVKAFRNRCPEITAFWRWLEQAINAAVLYGAQSQGYRLTIYIEGEFLRIRLPSGRSLSYHQPRMELHTTPYGKTKPTFTYMGMDQDLHKWMRLRAHMGGVTENIVQAIARDILVICMVRSDAKGLPIILHVHDEVGLCVWKARAAEALEMLLTTMREPISWAPDLLLDAGGYIAKHYKKD